MRKGKFPPKRLFIEDTLPRLGALSSSPLSSEFVFLLSFGEKSPTFPPCRWKFEQLVKHELSLPPLPPILFRRAWHVAHEKYAEKLLNKNPIRFPSPKKTLDTRGDWQIAEIIQYISFRVTCRQKEMANRKISLFRKEVGVFENYNSDRRMWMASMAKAIARWRNGRGGESASATGNELELPSFVQISRGRKRNRDQYALCPPLQPNFSGLPALITSIPYRIACHWQNG